MTKFDNQPTLIFWYFEWNTSVPTYDPWLDAPCIFCWGKLPYQKKTISIIKPWDSRSYFYRCCKDCYDSRTEEETNLYESSLIDKI